MRKKHFKSAVNVSYSLKQLAGYFTENDALVLKKSLEQKGKIV